MKKGISLVSLAVVIVVLTILTALITTGGVSSIKAVNLNKFAVEILNIQTKVNDYYYKYGSYPIGIETKLSTYNMDEETLKQFAGETITNNEIMLKTLDVEGLGIEGNTFGKNVATTDAYAVSHTTGRVYYLKGIDYEDRVFYTLTDDLFASTDAQNVINNDMISSDEIKVKDIIFKPSTIAYTNRPIEVMIKMPTSITVNSITTTNDKSVSAETIQGQYRVYVVNQTSTDRTGNYEIEVNYTYNEVEKTAKYEVTTFDNVKPSLSVTEEVNNNLKTVTITANDAESGIKIIKYIESEIEDIAYFETLGKELETNKITLEANSAYTIYVEDSAKNYATLIKIGESSVPPQWQKNVVKIYNTVPIPKGFVVSGADGENTKSEGLVIYEGTVPVTNENVDDARRTRNQYVWVPVSRKQFTESFVREILDGSNRTITNYLGSGDWEVQLNTETNLPESTQNSNFMTVSTPENGITNTLKEVQEMYASVKEYGGFYIARYEAGLENQRKSSTEALLKGRSVCSQMNKYPYNNINWSESNDMNIDMGGAVEVARSVYPANENTYGVVSTLVYGVQWDRTMKWWKETKPSIDLINSSTYGNHYDHTINSSNDLNEGAKANDTSLSVGYVDKDDSALEYPKKALEDTWLLTTGALKAAVINNIYDMAGNVFEYTMEGNGTEKRITRGGYFAYTNHVASRNSYSHLSAHAAIGFRISLYIKLN